jgi:hypothetical protein
MQVSDYPADSSLVQDSMLFSLCENETPILIFTKCTFSTGIEQNKAKRLKAVIIEYDSETLLISELNARTFRRTIYKSDISFLKPINNA